MLHYRKTRKHYLALRRQDGCPFCHHVKDDEHVRSTKHFYIVPNKVRYDLWEFHDVVDHLLVVPKRHIKDLAEFTKAERLELMDLLCEYEPEGYSIYARGAGFVRRSIEHQHTHLIKVSNKRPKAGFFLQKPYYLFKR